MLTTLTKTIFVSCLLFYPLILQAQLLDNATITTPALNVPGSLFNNANTGLSSSAIQSVLPADSAFALSAYIETPNTLVLLWEIKNGYYLYRKSLSFTETGTNSLQSPIIPTGIQTEDEFFGEVEVYYQRLLVRIPFDRDELGNSLALELSYQGCAEANYCYPMQTKSVSLEILQ
tara:strand:+ start:625 stop:1149 length:525 start_codon:yes stop_codon:yes gene_type:complete